MKASALEFRLRMGSWSPLSYWLVLHGLKLCILASAFRCWSGLSLEASGRACCASPMHAGGDSSGSLIALIGAILRVWARHLGYGTVHHGEMQAGGVMADGPYRYVRNPLYLGGGALMVANVVLMPPQARLVA